MLYLRHVISTAEMSPDLAKILVIADWPAPTTVCKIHSFLNFVKIFGDFLDSATELTSQLDELTTGRKQNKSIKMSAETFAVFE